MEPEGSVLCSQEHAMVPILNQMHLVHTLPHYFPKINSNIIRPSMTRSSDWSLPFKFSD